MDRQTAELMAQLGNQIDGLWKYLGHTREAEEAREKAAYWEKHVAGLKKEIEEHIPRLYSETKNYINTICAIGYAGYFAIWTLSKDQLTKEEASFVALMGLISIAVFCMWEVGGMLIHMRNLRAAAHLLRNTLTPEGFEEEKTRINAAEARLISVMTPIWIIALIVTIGCVFAGAFVAASRFYSSL